MNLKDQVKELINNYLQTNPTLFLTDLTVSAANAICVIIDGDQGVTIDDCINLSRAIEQNLDSEQVDFSLDVMSFGATEPFVNERQYTKNAGRTVQITTTDGKVHEGTLKGLTEGNAVLETQTREPKPVGKGKITVKKEHLFNLQNIKEAKVIIKF